MEPRIFHGQIRTHEAADDGAIRIKGWANVETEDRHGTILKADGFDVEAFRRNPAMFFNHDARAPIGVWDDVTVRDGEDGRGLWVEGRVFGDTALQRDVQTYIRQGTVKTLSVGFIPTAQTEEVRDDGETVVVYEGAELLEVSVVTIPSNRESVFSIARALMYGHDLIDRQPRAEVVGWPSIEAAIDGIIAHASGDQAKIRYAIDKLAQRLDDPETEDEIEDELIDRYVRAALSVLRREGFGK